MGKLKQKGIEIELYVVAGMFIIYGIIGFIVNIVYSKQDLGLFPALYGFAGAYGILTLTLIETARTKNNKIIELEKQILELKATRGENKVDIEVIVK